jgi:type IV secretory pathway VirB2 component (pilin)
MSSDKPITGSLVPAIVAIAFAAFALTFGMGDWRQAPTTASAPPTMTQH